VTSADVSVAGGPAGTGGPGGFSLAKKCTSYETPMEIGPGCSLDIDLCGIGIDPPCIEMHSCDCDKAYERLSMTSGVPMDNPALNLYEFKFGAELAATYNYATGELIGYEP